MKKILFFFLILIIFSSFVYADSYVYDTKNKTKYFKAYQVFDADQVPPVPNIGLYNAEYTSDQYLKINFSDNNRNSWTTPPGNTFKSLWYNFTILETVGDIEKLQVLWEGYDTLTQGGNFKIFIWNYTLNVWSIIYDQGVPGYVVDHVWLFNFTADLTDYIQNQDVHVAISGSKSGGGDCFIAGTQINMSDGDTKNIEDVEVGDYVLSYNVDNEKKEYKKVIYTYGMLHDGSEDDYTIIITFSDGSTNHNTYTNPYWVKSKGWVSYDPKDTKYKYDIDTAQMEIGDIVLTSELEELEIISIEEINDEIQTYNFIVEDNHNYFANNILVHNKFCAYLFADNVSDENFEFVTLGDFNVEGEIDSGFYIDRAFKENEGYSYIKLDHITNKFKMVIPPNEIDYIDYLGLKVKDTLNKSKLSLFENMFIDYPENIIYELQLINSNEGFKQMQKDDGQYYILDGETRYPFTLDIQFEELPPLDERYDRVLIFKEKGYYEYFRNSSIWYDFAPFNQTKWWNWLHSYDMRIFDNNYYYLDKMLDNLTEQHFNLNKTHSIEFESKMYDYTRPLDIQTMHEDYVFLNITTSEVTPTGIPQSKIVIHPNNYIMISKGGYLFMR